LERDGDADLLEPPEEADEEVAAVVDEGGLLALEGVADELEGPTRREHRGGERQADDGGADGQARGDERDADLVTSLVARILVIGLVVLHEVGPLGVQANHGVVPPACR